jgi:superfamily II DNA/RNA helicase
MFRYSYCPLSTQDLTIPELIYVFKWDRKESREEVVHRAGLTGRDDVISKDDSNRGRIAA